MSSDFYPRPPGGGRPVWSAPIPSRYSHFYPRPPGGGRLVVTTVRSFCFQFLSTPSGWRATYADAGRDLGVEISIHALRVEGDKTGKVEERDGKDFYPRPPGGGRPRVRPFGLHGRSISIHALRVEGDVYFFAPSPVSTDFYPRPPGGGRRIVKCYDVLRHGFLSTPSGWRATPPVSTKNRRKRLQPVFRDP